VRFLERTGNRLGLQQALRGILATGGSINVEWPLERALRVADDTAGVPVRTELYAQMEDTPWLLTFPTFGGVWASRAGEKARSFVRMHL
jgi:hypothetical protein